MQRCAQGNTSAAAAACQTPAQDIALLPLSCAAVYRNIDYDEFCRMMLTDEHERRGSKQEARTSHHTHSQRPHSRYVFASSVARACRLSPYAGRACRQHVGMQQNMNIQTTPLLVVFQGGARPSCCYGDAARQPARLAGRG